MRLYIKARPRTLKMKINDGSVVVFNVARKKNPPTFVQVFIFWNPRPSPFPPISRLELILNILHHHRTRLYTYLCEQICVI